ncbi:MAG: formate dehydrogenase subunit delta [Candidatus Binataceae bacterium]
MEIERLIAMANQIGEFFEAQRDHAVAVNAVAQHIKSFWEPRMRRQILQYARGDNGELRAIVREALMTLEPPKPPDPQN